MSNTEIAKLTLDDLQRVKDASRNHVLTVLPTTSQAVLELYRAVCQDKGLPFIVATLNPRDNVCFVLVNASIANPPIEAETHKQLYSLLRSLGDVQHVGSHGLGAFVSSSTAGELIADILVTLNAVPEHDQVNGKVEAMLNGLGLFNHDC